MIVMVAPPGALGIRRHTEALADVMRGLGWSVEVRSSSAGSDQVHFHFGNSSRALLPRMARTRNQLVTVHDVVPRDRRLRPFLLPGQRYAFSRHSLVVHSEHAQSVLSSYAPNCRADIVRLALPMPTMANPAALLDRLFLGWEAKFVAVIAGVLKAAKGIDEVVNSMPEFPEIGLLLMGDPADDGTATLLRSLPTNVRHFPHPDDEAFSAVLQRADVLITLRRESVGESSGPVVMAHSLGTPVAGLRTGSLPSYCGEGDILLDPEATAGQVLEAISRSAPLPRIPPDAAQVTSMAEAAAGYSVIYERLGWR